MTVAARVAALVALAALGPLALAIVAGAQAPARQVKVVIELRQEAVASQRGGQGAGGVVIRQEGGTARARGRGGVAVEDTTTRTTRSVGIFLVVEDGGAGTLMVTQEVPAPQIAWFQDYATGRGHVAQGIVWRQLGTGLVVRPVILPEGRIRIRVAPWLGYAAAGGGGTIELVEAATEMVVPAGRRVALGGATMDLHSVTRRILGGREERAGSETGIALTATVL